jgi:PTH1 family peptidyl-tRNA hydrolase
MLKNIFGQIKKSAFFKREKEIIPMYLIVGLGNPGKQYDMTRHNIGFHTIDYIAEKYGARMTKLKFKAVYGECIIAGEKVYLVKPQTYMNLSGDSVAEMAQFYKIPPENIIIINDDISLDTGRIRIRKKGSAGGHNGLKSIILRLNSDEFPRVKMGVGAPKHDDYDLADFVLGRFTKEEIPVMEEAIKKAEGAVSEIIKNGTESAMNKYNAK